MLCSRNPLFIKKFGCFLCHLDKINIMVLAKQLINKSPDSWKKEDIASETRNFALRDKKGNEIGGFLRGKQPRQAALKAANRGHKDIRLREGSRKSIYLRERVKVKKPKGAAWMPNEIWKPKVKKIGVKLVRSDGPDSFFYRIAFC